MEISVKNLGLIQYGAVKLDGLTVIAGENDTGKSTIGKTIFSVIKGMNNHVKDFKEDKFSKIEDIIEAIYFRFRDLTKSELEKNVGFSSSFLYPPKVRREVLHYINFEDFIGLENFIDRYIYNLNQELSKIDEQEKVSYKVPQLIEELKDVVNSIKNPKEYIYNSLMIALQSEFGNDLNNKFTNEMAEILYSENGEEIINVFLANNKIVRGTYTDTPLEIGDATYIESPLIFQLYKIISDTKGFSSKSRKSSNKNNLSIPLHFKDLISKMSDSFYYDLFVDDFDREFAEEISEIIDGDSDFNSDIEDFLFSREYENDMYSFGTSNVASGIKSFSILQMLLKSQSINERGLIIIDEPEIHLHPKWQVKYCEIIVKLAKKGVRILVTSHSPYTIQALKFFSKHYEFNNKTHFYLTEKIEDKKQTRIVNVDHDLNSVFKKLSEPLKMLL